MIMGEGDGASHDVDIILGGGYLMMMLGYKGGRRGFWEKMIM